MSLESIVNLESVSAYQQKNLVLRDIKVNINKGEFVYLIGKTGSGKSSLLKVIYADLNLADGSGNVVGYDLKKLKTKDIPMLRRKLGIIFQDFNLLTDRTVADNLLFVLKATGWTDKTQMQLRIDKVLDMVGLQNKGYKKPFELSGGEQQRVVIARALLNEPKLILADEPTGNLDPETSDEIMNLLKKLNKETGTPIIMATHDYSILEKFPSRILKCVNGTLSDSDSEEIKIPQNSGEQVKESKKDEGIDFTAL